VPNFELVYDKLLEIRTYEVKRQVDYEMEFALFYNYQ